MSNQLQVIQPKLIPQSQGNFVLIKMPEGYRGHLHCLDFVIETNYKVIDAKIAYLLGISHEWCTEYIGGEQNFTKFKVKALHGIYGVLDCITVEQFHILCSKARNTRADKYQPKLLELISQVLPITRHDDKENQIMTTNQLININQQKIGDQQVNAVSARELWKFLESKREFTHWVKPYITEDNDYGFVEGVDFIAVDVGVNRISQQVMKDYWFTIDMAKEVSMLSKTEKGKQARKYFIECERKANNPQLTIPQSYSAALLEAAKLAEQTEKLQLELKSKDEQIAHDKAFTKLGKMMTMADATIKVGDYAIMLQNEHGIKIGQNRLFEWLREHGYLCKEEKQKNRPTQKSMELGLFTYTQRLITTNHGEEIFSFTPRLTGKAQVYFIDKLIKDFSPTAA